MSNEPATEDRVWAVLSHLSALTFGIGILLPVVGWSEQRRKSNYASFQCLQALGYQSLGYTVWLLTYLLSMIVLVVIMLVALSFTVESRASMDAFMGIWMSILLFVMFGTLGSYFLLPVIAAVSCARGRDFRYPLMGNRLASYLGYDPRQAGDEQAWLIQDHEDRWVAAMGHFSVIIPIWGILAPLTTWVLQGKRSLFLKFQSIQTLAYQGGVLLLYFGSGFVYVFGLAFTLASMSLTGGLEADAPIGTFYVVFFLATLLISFAIVLVIPLLHILGQYAGYRVLKGDDYRYPLVGGLVEKWIPRKSDSSVEKGLA